MNKGTATLHKKLILASASPRRKELLTQVGFCFEIKASNKDEKSDAAVPSERVISLSACKAKDVFEHLTEGQKRDCLVIGADTLVAYGSVIMGKPKDESQAEEMLSLIAGQTHQVYTGVTMLWMENNGSIQESFFFEKTDVSMYPMKKEEIREYVSTGEPMDKAGAYAIQGKCAAYIKGISGDYNNVVGLPIGRICQEMKAQKIIVKKY